jgi:hypothetical protein
MSPPHPRSSYSHPPPFSFPDLRSFLSRLLISLNSVLLYSPSPLRLTVMWWRHQFPLHHWKEERTWRRIQRRSPLLQVLDSQMRTASPPRTSSSRSPSCSVRSRCSLNSSSPAPHRKSHLCISRPLSLVLGTSIPPESLEASVLLSHPHQTLPRWAPCAVCGTATLSAPTHGAAFHPRLSQCLAALCLDRPPRGLLRLPSRTLQPCCHLGVTLIWVLTGWPRSPTTLGILRGRLKHRSFPSLLFPRLISCPHGDSQWHRHHSLPPLRLSVPHWAPSSSFETSSQGSVYLSCHVVLIL